jgi:hypothetical protein
MAVSIKDLVKDLTPKEVLDDILTVAKALGLPTTAWQPGEPIYGVLSIVSQKLADYWNNIIVRAIRSGFLDYGEGDWLTLEAFLTYYTRRKGETFAELPVTLQNRGGGNHPFVPGDVHIQNDNGKVFTNITGGTLAFWSGGAAPYPTVTLKFRADEAGSGSNTLAGGFAGYPTPPLEAPAGVFVVPNTTEAFGQDEETDASLVERARLQTGTLSVAGPRAAYEYVAKSTMRSDGTFVDVSRVRLIPLAGSVYVYLASPTGAATGDTSIEGSDVYLVNIQIQNKVAPVGINVNVSAAVEVSVAYTIDLSVLREGNLTAEDAIAAAAPKLSEYFETLPIGGHRLTPGGQGYVIASELAAIASESTKGIFRATVTPNLDTPLESNEVALPILTINATVITQS